MTKHMSKRQKQRATQNRSRMLTIGFVIGGALLIALALILPNFNNSAKKPGTDVVVPEAVTRPSGDGLTLGDTSAPARIEVFEDFQCPACKQYSESVEPLVLEQLVATGKAYYIFQNYPFLDTNNAAKESRGAANASLCANDQGKFWEYHDVLFANWNGENQGSFSGIHLVEFASALELNLKDFQACVDENRHETEIQASFNKGTTMGVSGTPSVFVNGILVRPGFIPTYEDIASSVEAVQP